KTYFLRYPVAAEFGPSESGGMTPREVRENYFKRFPYAAAAANSDILVKVTDSSGLKTSKGGGQITHGKSGPVQLWPTTIMNPNKQLNTYPQGAIFSNDIIGKSTPAAIDAESGQSYD